MRKSFVYWHFPEMSILLKSRNHFNFSAPSECRFLFKPITFVYSGKQSESEHGLFTLIWLNITLICINIIWLIHSISEMAAYFNLNNNEISKELLINKFDIILDHQSRPTWSNDQKIPLSNEPQRSSRFVQKQPREVFSNTGVFLWNLRNF